MINKDHEHDHAGKTSNGLQRPLGNPAKEITVGLNPPKKRYEGSAHEYPRQRCPNSALHRRTFEISHCPAGPLAVATGWALFSLGRGDHFLGIKLQISSARCR